MAQTASATLRSKAAATERVISRELRIAWGRDADAWPNDWATESTDETTNLLDVSWDRRLDLTRPLGQGAGPVAQMRLTLDNASQRFSPFNEAGALFSLLTESTTTPGGETVTYPRLFSTPVRLRMGFYAAASGHEYNTVFSGLIDEPGETFGLAGDKLQLTVLDRGAALLQNKKSTAINENVAVDKWIRYMVSTLGGITTGATLERAFFHLPYIWLDDESLWTEVQAAAQSDGGYAYFDETGAFYYRNAAWWATATDSTTTTNTATISTKFQNFNPGYSWRDMTTGVIVQYQPRAPGGEQVVWRSDETIVVPPSGKTIEVKFSYPVSILLTPANPGDWLPISGGGIDMSSNVSLDVQEQYAQRAKLVFTNTSYQTVFIPKMQLRGLALIGGPQEQIDQDATSALVPENKPTISGNAYIQTKGQAEMLAVLNAYRLSYPRLTHKFSGVPALPWLQLGDRIAITGGTSAVAPYTADRYGIITGLSFSWKPDGPFVMDVEAVDVAGLFEYDNYHVLGTHDYGERRVFV